VVRGDPAAGLVRPWLAPHDLTALRGEVYGPALSGAPLGFDYLGRDVLSRVLAGGRSLVLMSLAAATLALLVGTALGLLAGFSRGWATACCSGWPTCRWPFRI
jgi:ABC-type dipeptide/oligopeptide/nickel transport system permease subunit